MTKLNGIKSVDFKLVARGEGIVNWNGSFNILNNQAGQFVKNHQVPKMRGVDPMRLKTMNDKQWENAKVFVSQNCIRHAIFKNETLNLKTVDSKNVDRVLCSLIGLLRGYVIADKVTKLSLKRKSPLLLEDFVEQGSVLRYEQFSNAGERNETSIFSRTNVDTTHYIGYGSIAIEDLQFIVLEDSFNRSSYSDILSLEQGKEITNQMNIFLQSLSINTNKNPLAVFHHNYVRIGGITNDGEAGMLLNDDAIDLVINEIMERFRNLYIHQSKGYLTTEDLTVDYNSGQPMRIKRDQYSVSAEKNDFFAIYYNAVDFSEKEYQQKMDTLKKFKDGNKFKKAKNIKEEELIEIKTE